MFSAASCCGLIEAIVQKLTAWVTDRFPQHHAAASLKPATWRSPSAPRTSFPQHHAAASLKPNRGARACFYPRGFSAASCCGLIEARPKATHQTSYNGFSAASCCGLIEAAKSFFSSSAFPAFSAASCCGLIEAYTLSAAIRAPHHVFRSIMLRPH